MAVENPERVPSKLGGMRVSAPHQEVEQCHHGDTDDEGSAERRVLEGDIHSEPFPSSV